MASILRACGLALRCSAAQSAHTGRYPRVLVAFRRISRDATDGDLPIYPWRSAAPPARPSAPSRYQPGPRTSAPFDPPFASKINSQYVAWTL